MESSTAIVTAWDAPNGTLLASLLGSIAAIGDGGRAVRVLVPDAAAADAVVAMASGAVAVPIGGGEAFAARVHDTLPLLPTIVHGFARYFWIDPAAWLVRDDAFQPYDQGVDLGGLAGVYELDRAYRVFASAKAPWRSYRDDFRALFGEETARRMYFRPLVNLGMIALAADAPHWAAWRTAFDRLDRERKAWSHGTVTACQLALNLALIEERLPVVPLPALWNWLCHWERPFWDGERLVESEPPWAPIRVLHLTGQSRRREMAVPGTRGAHFRSHLRFPLAIAPRGRKAA